MDSTEAQPASTPTAMDSTEAQPASTPIATDSTEAQPESTSTTIVRPDVQMTTTLSAMDPPPAAPACSLSVSEQPHTPAATDLLSKPTEKTKPTEQDEMQPEKAVFKMPMFGTKPTIKKKTGLVSEAFGSSYLPVTASVTVDNEDKTDKAPKNKPVLASPAETTSMKQFEIPLPYKEPAWGGPVDGYAFEVIRNGTVIDKLDLATKSFHIFGRLPSCDFTLEHPSLSRYHAVVQFCEEPSEKREVGWYLYDLDSTHGTWINKNQVKPQVYNRLRVGHVVKFGGSTRLFILQPARKLDYVIAAASSDENLAKLHENAHQGPDEDQDEESELSLTEMKEQRERQKRETELLKQADLAEAADAQKRMEKAAESQHGCSWGIDDDAENEETTENPFSLSAPQDEELYLEDPKKALKGYFEREGLELPEYKTEDVGHSKHKCSVELPIDDAAGRPLVAQVTVEGKKREAVVECALEACRMLDRHGELRKSTHESHARKKRDWEEDDFYDSDEDTFLDRTGAIEKKRLMRMKIMGKKKEKAETFDSLNAKVNEINTQITALQQKLDKAKQNQAAFEEEGMDAFDAYMESLKSGALDTKTKMKMKRELLELRREQMRLQKLLAIARPALPQIQPRLGAAGTSAKKPLPMIGKMKGPSRFMAPQPQPMPSAQSSTTGDGSEEEEEDDDEEDKTTRHSSLDKAKQFHTPLSKPPKSSNNDTKSKTDFSSRDSIRLPEGDITSTNLDKDIVSQPLSVPAEGDLVKQAKCVTSSDSVTTSSVLTSKIQGPTIPQLAEEKMDISESSVSDTVVSSSNETENLQEKTNVPKNKAKKRKVQMRRPAEADPEYSELQSDPNYHVWVPPDGQTGDGKTSLNAKFGY